MERDNNEEALYELRGTVQIVASIVIPLDSPLPHNLFIAHPKLFSAEH